MSSSVKPITVAIMDKEYVVGCAEDERESLFASGEFLNRNLREQRDSGKVIGSERVAVMAALNIAHEYLDYRRRNENVANDMVDGIERIHRKIQSALSRGAPEMSRPSHGTN